MTNKLKLIKMSSQWLSVNCVRFKYKLKIGNISALADIQHRTFDFNIHLDFYTFLYKTWYWYKHKMLRAIAVNCGTFRMIGFLFQKTCKMDAGHENLNKIVVKNMFISPCVWQAPRPNLPSVRQASYRDLPSFPEVESPHAWAIWNLRQTKSKDWTQNQFKRLIEIFKDYWKISNFQF